MKQFAIRGAITVAENTEEAIKNATVELLNSIIEKNNLNIADMLYINFSATKDITKAYPAKFVRTELGITDVPMMCYQEMYVENSLPMCIRILIVVNTINKEFFPRHIYLGGAKILRPDITIE
ncbi:chorismate mutase [bacterium]|nr:chorismate mutase [bacterium]